MKTKPPPSTQLQKAVFGGPLKSRLLLCAAVLACGSFTGLAQSPPDLLIDLGTDSRVRLSWPETPGSIVLEETDSLTLWQPSTQVPTLLDGQFSVLADISGGTRFFRLHETGGLPPDPVSIAPPIQQGIATLLAEATEFLYTGANRIQTGVAPGTIEARRAAVLRGTVHTRAGDALSGVTVSILAHPELGQTLSRADGAFDLAVNGGGLLTVDYQKEGFLPVQRQVNVPWQDYATLPDVVLIELDTEVTPVTLGTAAMQVARGSAVSDADGTRRATLLVPAGTTASLVMPDGTTQPIGALSVRATEYTVGADGPDAMPGVLPPASGYTYAVELSADEAIAAGAMSVRFSQPLPYYVENFLGFPVGGAVPAGYYDRTKAAWVPSLNGRVVRITAIAGGMASVDSVGSGSLVPLTLSDAERQQLASLYPMGQELWRVPTPHFTPWDHNWPYGLPDDAITPADNGARADPDYGPQQCATEVSGSIIECENQVLGDSGPIAGTPYSLNYRSDRVPGRVANRMLNIKLGGPTVPASLRSIQLHLTVGGQTMNQTFAAAPNQQTTFVWDGLDAYGRPVQGGQLAGGSIDYVYPAVYKEPGAFGAAFAQFGEGGIAGNPERGTITLSLPISEVLGEGYADARMIGLGGWTLSGHHFYDPVGRVLHTGDGRRRRASSIGNTITTVAGNGVFASSGDGGSATQASIRNPLGAAVGPDGSLYIAEANGNRIRRVTPDGIITTVAGIGVAGFTGDGGPAIEARINGPRGVAVAPDGSVHLTDSGSSRIRRIGLDGVITTVAGNGASDSAGDGGPATQAALGFPSDLAFGPDGSLYISARNVVRRVGPDGIITTVAGSGAFGFSGDGGPATQAALGDPRRIALGPDGSLYLSEISNQRVRRVGVDGIITTVAGNGVRDSLGDGGLAIQASLFTPQGIAAGSDGNLYIVDHRVRRVAPDGIITTIAGKGLGGRSSGDGGPATAAEIFAPDGIALAPDGSLYVVEGGNRVRRVAPPLPGFSGSDIAIVSEDGGLLYQFNAAGRHLRTLDALTGASLFEFGFDADGRLAQVTEKTGGTDNVTTILHDGAGNPTAIVGPFGQQTTLAVDANGFLESIINPANDEMQFTSTANGLLTAYTDPSGKTSVYLYGGDGRLIQDADPAGGTQTLAGVAGTDTFTVTRTTALDRVTTYQTAKLPGNIERRTTTAPDGTQILREEAMDAGTTRLTAPDGTLTELELAPDPRFGMQAPVAKSLSVALPSGLTFTAASTQTADLSDPNNPLSLVQLTGTSSVGGHTTTSTYTAATRTFVNTTPVGRVQTSTLDALGRMVDGQHGDLAPISLSYDARGRLAALSLGDGVNARTNSFAYNALGSLESVSDHAGRTTNFVHDAAGRITSHTLADGSIVGFGFDATGNLTSLTPPGRPPYSFAYSSRNELTAVTPPPLAGTGPTTYAYNADRQVTMVGLPDGRTISQGYDSSGRPISRTITAGGVTNATYHATYDPSSGQLLTITGPDAQTLTYAYDGGQIVSVAWSGAVTGIVDRTYDTAFRLASESVNGNNPVNFTYDNDGLLTGAGDLTLQRDAANGLPTTDSLGIVDQALNFSGFGELAEQDATASGAPLYHATYTRDLVGRVVQKAEAIQGVTNTYTYTYDSLSRLTDVSRDGTTIESYVYDSNGNRTNATVGGSSSTSTYDDQDRLTQNGTVQYAYNASGQLVTRTDGAQTTSYDYDAQGNLMQVTLPDGTDVSYLIDGANRRVGRQINGVSGSRFLYSGQRPVAELDGSGAVVSRFVYAVSRVPAFLIQGGVAFRILTDRQGSVRLVVNSTTGAIVQRLDYDSFGNVTLDTNPGFQPFGFAGGFYDPASKLVRFGARDYEAETGRWTTRDPFWFAGGDSNLYRYCRNDPVNLVDPLGNDPTDLEWIQHWKGVIETSKASIERLRNTRVPPGLTPQQREELKDFVLEEIAARKDSKRLAESELKRLRELANRKSLVPVGQGKVNCGGLASKAFSALAVLDFAVVYQRARDSGRSFFEELDIQADDQKDEQIRAGVHTSVGFLGPFPYVMDLEGGLF